MDGRMDGWMHVEIVEIESKIVEHRGEYQKKLK
jgi:hypothetical protein